MTGQELTDICGLIVTEFSRIVSFACGSFTALAFVLASAFRF